MGCVSSVITKLDCFTKEKKDDEFSKMITEEFTGNFENDNFSDKYNGEIKKFMLWLSDNHEREFKIPDAIYQPFFGKNSRLCYVFASVYEKYYEKGGRASRNFFINYCKNNYHNSYTKLKYHDIDDIEGPFYESGDYSFPGFSFPCNNKKDTKIFNSRTTKSSNKVL